MTNQSDEERVKRKLVYVAPSFIGFKIEGFETFEEAQEFIDAALRKGKKKCK